MSPKRRMTKLMKFSPLKRISKNSDVSALVTSLPMVSKKHSESLIDSLNDQMFGIKYQQDEKVKKYKNIINDRIMKSKYIRRSGNPFANTSGKLSLPNIRDRGDLDWNALT